MPRPSKLKQAEAAIVETLNELGKRVLGHSDLRQALAQNRTSWELKRTTTLPEFIEFIERSSRFQVHQMTSDQYGQNVVRYSLQPVSAHELALSLRPRSYLSHRTAAELHQLFKPDTKLIYVNSEQSAKSPPTGSLTQHAIDNAFASKQKPCKLIYRYKKAEIVALNGKQTGQLGVIDIKGAIDEPILVTNLERTLIDIAVRPAYAGGADELLKAFRKARGRASVDLLIEMLKTIDHKYPFHQSIGFLMSRSGYPEADCAKLADLGIEHDFYVDYGISKRVFSQQWRMHYPADWD